MSAQGCIFSEEYKKFQILQNDSNIKNIAIYALQIWGHKLLFMRGLYHLEGKNLPYSNFLSNHINLHKC